MGSSRSRRLNPELSSSDASLWEELPPDAVFGDSVSVFTSSDTSVSLPSASLSAEAPLSPSSDALSLSDALLTAVPLFSSLEAPLSDDSDESSLSEDASADALSCPPSFEASDASEPLVDAELSDAEPSLEEAALLSLPDDSLEDAPESFEEEELSLPEEVLSELWEEEDSVSYARHFLCRLGLERQSREDKRISGNKNN